MICDTCPGERDSYALQLFLIEDVLELRDMAAALRECSRLASSLGCGMQASAPNVPPTHPMGPARAWHALPNTAEAAEAAEVVKRSGAARPFAP